MGNVVFSIIWFLLLIFVAFWVAGICAGLYIILHPLSVCFDFLTQLTDVLLKGIQLPYLCAQGMMEGKSFG